MMDYRKYDAHKAISRAGNNYLFNKLYFSGKWHASLPGKDTLDIFNIFGIPLSIIILIANSHGLNVDEEEFKRLLDEQEKEVKYKCLDKPSK